MEKRGEQGGGGKGGKGEEGRRRRVDKEGADWWMDAWVELNVSRE